MPDKSNMAPDAVKYQAPNSSGPFCSKSITFIRSHSLEIPGMDINEGDVLEVDWDLDLQVTNDLLGIFFAEECGDWLTEASPEPSASQHQGVDDTIALDCLKSITPDEAIVVEKPTRQRRVSSKQRIEKLRDEVKALSMQLHKLSSFTTRQSQLWQQIAGRQLERRQEAEKKNAELREMMEIQIQEAENVRRALKRHARVEVCIEPSMKMQRR